MSLITNIRIGFGRRALLKEAGRITRNTRAINLKDAREIGILFSMNSEEEYDRVSKFARSLQEHGKKVQVIGFCKYRTLPPYYAPKLAYDIILPNNLDLFYRPTVKFVRNFVEQPFDMLIDLSQSVEFPLYYIAMQSKAAFKLGRKLNIVPLPYDMMIETTEVETEKLINEIVHYTSSFKISSQVKG